MYFDRIYMSFPEFLSDPPLPLIQFHVLLPLKENKNQLS